MEQVGYFKKGNGSEKVASLANAWGLEAQAFQRSDTRSYPNEQQPTPGHLQACRGSQREFQKARDRLKRANRDLGETAAFIAAALTTVTAVQAVIGFANEKIGLSPEILQLAFAGYILIIIGIVLIGALRGANALYRRRQAEHAIDNAKKGIFYYCPVEEWPKADE